MRPSCTSCKSRGLKCEYILPLKKQSQAKWRARLVLENSGLMESGKLKLVASSSPVSNSKEASQLPIAVKIKQNFNQIPTLDVHISEHQTNHLYFTRTPLRSPNDSFSSTSPSPSSVSLSEPLAATSIMSVSSLLL
ncbi:hypothetical protein HK100_012794 [Physocladia obscura]|uniref:Zn(2)-C6 fungal-type domain-containing protein n=1 Tax=Physocladia obscura TaxID=109957 RepID=A0AAD5T224_9FUNG|nr:hypothetical protein HK100_012794 [Physocladia obscura]